MTLATTMPPWYGAPRPARVRAGPRTDRRSTRVHGARTTRRAGRRVARGFQGVPGRGNLGKVCDLGRHTASERRGGPDAKAARRQLARTRFAEPLFEHAKLQNFE
jgi:hypothetical protein